KEVTRDTPESVAEQILQWPEGTKFYVLSPIHTTAPAPARGRKKARVKKAAFDPIAQLRQQGFTRLFADGNVIDISAEVATVPGRPEDLHILVDRLVVKPGLRPRLIDSLETAFREGEGKAEIFILPDSVAALQASNGHDLARSRGLDASHAGD